MHASATLNTIYNLVPFFCHQSNWIANCQLVLYRITTLYHIISPFLHSIWVFHAGGRWRAVEETQQEERQRGQGQEESQKSAQVDVR